MSSKQAMLMAKLGGKNKSLSAKTEGENVGLPTATTGESADFRGIKDGVKDSGPGISAKTGGSLGILKSTKASSMGMPTTKAIGENPAETITEGELPVMKTKTYSPIKNYLRKGK